MWQQFPSLVEPRADASATILGDSLYVFGGVTNNQSGLFDPIKTIERLLLKGTPQQKEVNAFQVIDIKLPISVCSLGVLPVSQTETLLLGGFGSEGINSD